MNRYGIEGLIFALEIFAKYTDENYPTACVHDALLIPGVGRFQPTEPERERLKQRGFDWIDEHNCWGSFVYGSA